ncbi:hypothetical protein PSP6_210180 [Paraburkholderia tropica]|nr:hypothetical protein PSP6_210180 [Paraburkholderia tropica]
MPRSICHPLINNYVNNMDKLFSHISVGPFELDHRVVLAPLTRMRTERGNVAGDLMVDYYTQRASSGGLLISDATAVSPLGIAYVDAPGIYTEEQVKGWKRVTDAVHAKGARIFLQMWHAGRQAHPANTGGLTPVAPSALRSLEHAVIRDGYGNIVEAELVVPRVLEIEEIAVIVAQFRRGAELAKQAGFDGGNCTVRTDTCSSSSCWTARTSVRTNMAARLKFARAFCSTRSMPSCPCGGRVVWR